MGVAINNIMNHYRFQKKNTLFVKIKGVEYAYNEFFEFKKKILLKENYFFGYDIFNEKDVADFYNVLSNDDFVDGVYTKGVFFNKISSEDYFARIKYLLENAETCELKKKNQLNYWFVPFHVIRNSEVESCYDLSVTVVMSGIEYEEWSDGAYKDAWLEPSGRIMPDFIAIIGSPKEEIKHIPVNEISHREECHGNDYYVSFDYVPKKYLDKIILYRRYRDASDIERLPGYYTGEFDKLELDVNNPNFEILCAMKEYKICEEKIE